MGRYTGFNRFVDFLYRTVGQNAFSFRAFILYGFVAGVGGIIIDLDHLIIVGYFWFYGKVPRGWWLEGSRPLHIPIFIVSCILIWYCSTHIRRCFLESILVDDKK